MNEEKVGKKGYKKYKNRAEEYLNVITSYSIHYTKLYDKCTFCGKCQEICQFNAITVLKNKVLIFDELCHSCGGCERICPVV